MFGPVFFFFPDGVGGGRWRKRKNNKRGYIIPSKKKKKSLLERLTLMMSSAERIFFFCSSGWIGKRYNWDKVLAKKKKHRGISRFFFFLVGLNFLLLSSHVFFLFESRDFSLYNERCTSSSSLSLRVCWTINQQRERIPPGALYANESWVGIVRAHAPPASSQPLRAVIFFFLPGENVGQSVQFVALLLSSSFSVSLSLSFSPGVRPGFFFFLSFLFYYYLVAKSFALRFSFDFSFFFDAQLTIYLYMV